jgi:RNA-directed DNA polymerase
MTNILQNWRLNWQETELEWRDDWRVDLDQRDQQREEAHKIRALQDRQHFGQDLWGVSQEHLGSQEKLEVLKQFDLPQFESEQALADWLKLSLPKLRWLTFDKAADKSYHYIRFTRPKKLGGERVILAPKKELKAIQRKILHEILEKLPQSPYAHGFVSGHSIVSNAAPHVGKTTVINMDLKDFFPTITYPRVRGLFLQMGYSFSIASTLALLCTERDRLPYKRGKAVFYISVGARTLIQGAPTSPALSNLIVRNLDRRLAGLASKLGYDYTRYADDLSFSSQSTEKAWELINTAKRIVRDEGFTVHPEKVHLFHRSTRQMVTGLVVNEQVAVPRHLRRTVRAVLNNAKATGLNAQNRQGHPDFRAYLQGLIAHITHANPEHGAALSEMLKQIND